MTTVNGIPSTLRRRSVKGAAQHTDLSESYLNKLRSQGGGPDYFKIGRRVVYDTCDLDEWLERLRRRSTSDRGGANAGGL